MTKVCLDEADSYFYSLNSFIRELRSNFPKLVNVSN